MKIAAMPIAFIMQRSTAEHRWGAIDSWRAVAVVPDRGALGALRMLSTSPARDYYLAGGIELELHTDENEGYYENIMSPEPKVFVLWRMVDGRAVPARASVSYVEGTRMFDSGEQADGVTMPAEIYQWAAGYLREHFTPRPRKGRQHG